MIEDRSRALPRGVVAVRVYQCRLLTIRRSQFVVAPGRLCFPGGAIERGESEPQALHREIVEELGVVVRPLRRLWRSTTPWDVELAWWLVDMDPAATLTINPREVESIHWYTPTQMWQCQDLLESNRQFFQAWRRGEFQLPHCDCPDL